MFSEPALTGHTHELLAGKKAFPVIVAVIDMGVDTAHEDLAEHHDLKDQIRPDRSEDLAQRDAGRRHALEIERGGTERRRDVGDLHVEAEEYAEPDEIEAQLLGDRHEDRRGQEQDADPVDEAAEDDPDDLEHDDDVDRLQRQRRHRVLDQPGAAGERVDADQRRRAEEQPVQHDRDLGGLLDGVPHARQRHPAVDEHGKQRPDDADTSGLGGRGDAQVEGAEHHQRDHAGDDEIPQHRQLLAQRTLALFGWRGRRQLRRYRAADDDVGAVGTGKQQTRNDARHVQLADRNARGQAVEDEDDAGRNERRQSAAGANAAERDALVVTAAEHRRQRDDAHGDDLGADYAHHRRHQRAGEDDRHGQAAGNASEPDMHGAKDGVGHASSLEDAGHEDEKRHGDEHIVAHQREHAADDQRQPRQTEQRIGKHDRHRPGRKGQRDAGEKDDDEDDDEQDAQKLDAHGVGPASGTMPSSRTRLAMPCSSSSRPAIGMAILTGQIGGFQGVPVPSDCRNELQAISEPTQTSAPT